MKPAIILVVEDNPISMKMNRVALEAEKYTVLMAENGYTALQLAQTHPIDLILLDLSVARHAWHRVAGPDPVPAENGASAHSGGHRIYIGS
jgi:CheY-like chemotaxis protein